MRRSLQEGLEEHGTSSQKSILNLYWIGGAVHRLGREAKHTPCTIKVYSFLVRTKMRKPRFEIVK